MRALTKESRARRRRIQIIEFYIILHLFHPLPNRFIDCKRLDMITKNILTGISPSVLIES
jgi:hypothetical protein